MKKSFVYLVGAGPGRADLITVRGAEVLKKADCIIYDKLANPALLKYARADAEIIHVPKRIGKGSTTQDEINRLIIEKAACGRVVVRLKGGDPCIFGRVAEEIAVLREAGIGFEIVPGITAGIAVSSYTGIMLTDRQYSSQVTFITGREAEGKEDSNIDWEVLAKFSGTLVFYMGIGNLNKIAENLIKYGRTADTPAAVISNVTLPTQRVVKSDIENIHQECISQKIEPPAIIVIGDAAHSENALDWFMKQPLFGKNIVVTRDEAGNEDFAEKIIARGGNPVQFATFKIKALTDSNDFLRAMANLAGYDWITFTSCNGVDVFFGALEILGKDARVFGPAKIAAIGTQTASKLTEYGIKADFVPSVFTSAEFSRQFLNFANLKGKKVLLLRSELASNELDEILQKAGAIVDDIATYTAVPQQNDSAWLIEKIRSSEIDWLTFASPSAVDNFFGQISSEIIKSSKVKIASVGPVTSKQLDSHGVKIDVTADEHTFEGLLDAIEQVLS